MNETLLNTRDAAAALGISTSTLEKLRMKEGGPKFHRIGTPRRIVRYRRSDLDDWVAAGAASSTTQSEGA